MSKRIYYNVARRIDKTCARWVGDGKELHPTEQKVRITKHFYFKPEKKNETI